MVWSTGLVFLTGLSVGDGLLWLLVLLFSATELAIAWAAGSLYQAVTVRSVRDLVLKTDLSQLTATWGPSELTTSLHVQFVALGLLIGLLLSVGTWLPVTVDGTLPVSAGITTGASSRGSGAGRCGGCGHP